MHLVILTGLCIFIEFRYRLYLTEGVSVHLYFGDRYQKLWGSSNFWVLHFIPRLTVNRRELCRRRICWGLELWILMVVGIVICIWWSLFTMKTTIPIFRRLISKWLSLAECGTTPLFTMLLVTLLKRLSAYSHHPSIFHICQVIALAFWLIIAYAKGKTPLIFLSSTYYVYRIA